MKKYVLFLLFFCFTCILFAQKTTLDYIVKKGGDTIWCTIVGEDDWKMAYEQYGIRKVIQKSEIITGKFTLQKDYIVKRTGDTIWCRILGYSANLRGGASVLAYLDYRENGVRKRIRRKEIQSYWSPWDNKRVEVPLSKKEEVKSKLEKITDPNYFSKFDSSLVGLTMDYGSVTSGGDRYLKVNTNTGQFEEKQKSVSRNDLVYFENGKFCHGRNYKVLLKYFDQVPKAKRKYKLYLMSVRINTFAALTWLGTMPIGLNIDGEKHRGLKISILSFSAACLLSTYITYLSSPRTLQKAFVIYNKEILKSRNAKR